MPFTKIEAQFSEKYQRKKVRYFGHLEQQYSLHKVTYTDNMGKKKGHESCRWTAKKLAVKEWMRRLLSREQYLDLRFLKFVGCKRTAASSKLDLPLPSCMLQYSNSLKIQDRCERHKMSSQIL